MGSTLMKHLLIFLALTACAWSQPTMPFAMWKSAAVAPAGPDSLTHYYVASDMVDSLGKVAGDTTYIWPNRVNRASSMYQLTASKKPVVRTDSAGGRACVVFDGSNDIMQSPTATIAEQPNTMFIVARYHAPRSGTNTQMLGDVAWDMSLEIHELFVRTPNYRINLYAGRVYQTNYTPRADSAIVICAVFHGKQSSLYVNGRWFGSGDAGEFEFAPVSLGGDPYGALRHWRGSVYEVRVYDGLLTADERTAVTNEMLTRYNLPAY